MSEELTPRARAILDAAERLAAAPTTPSDVPAPAAGAADLAELAEQVRVMVETVRARLDELTERIDALTAQLRPSAPAAPDDAPRLLAVELAVVGATRADVDARLREHFGLRSTTELLDAVFGVGSPPGARLPWA